MTTLKSQILLVKNIKMDREYKNVLSLSENQILALCQNQNNLIASRNDYSFIRTQGSILTDFDYDDCLQGNYIAFQNKDYSNKWFFAWIDDVIYNGDLNTEIRYTVDEWSTWYSGITKKACFVVREHVNDDTIGLHTIDEGLGVEDVICESEEIVEPLDMTRLTPVEYYGLWIVVTSNWNPAGNNNAGEGFDGAIMFNNNVFGQMIFLFPLNDDGVYDLENFLYIVNKQGHIGDVHDMFIIPKTIIPDLSTIVESKTVVYGLPEVTTHYKIIRYDNNLSDTIRTGINKYISPLHTFNGYNPKNNKCFVYPFNYLFVTNNIGSKNIYKYEDFILDEDGELAFNLQLSLSIGRFTGVLFRKITKVLHLTMMNH